MVAATATLPLPGLPAPAAAVLDDPAAWDEFSRPVPGGAGRWESYLAVEGMYCPGCSLVIERALGTLPGVCAVQVNGSTATARIEWTPGASRPSEWIAALRAPATTGCRPGTSSAPRPGCARAACCCGAGWWRASA